MGDLVSRVLVAIKETERDLRAKAGDERHQAWAMEESPDYNEGAIVTMALDGLRRCAADRGVVDMYRGAQLHPMLHDPYSYAAGQHDALWQAVQLIAFGYGISTEEKPPDSVTDPS